MKGKYFLKDHPGIVIKEQSPCDLGDLSYTNWTMEELLKTIHETQIDKGKAREDLEELWSNEETLMGKYDGHEVHSMKRDLYFKILKKLGIQ